ncbi:mucosal pentraxin-like [Pleurodeles waltl]|uniref:mucosal pentraxin-like n=1 Tax=Pleurodeles waltl TaxID=8319 RepID=UPI00370946FE
MELSFPLMIGILGAATHAVDLGGSLFLFPSESAYVTLEPEMTAPLKSFTVCLRAFTEHTRHHGLFSVNNSTHGVYIQLSVNQGEFPFSVFVGGKGLQFKDLGYGSVRRQHICVTWDSDTGVTQVFLNAEKLARKVVNQGYTIEGPLQITLGQKKHLFGAYFYSNPSFVGEIGDVHMWNSVQHPQVIYLSYDNSPGVTGNVLNWRNLRYETKGGVLVLPVQ